MIPSSSGDQNRIYRYNSLIMDVPQARKNSISFLRYLKERLLPILVNRTVIFLFLMCLLTMFLYVVGTIQGFIDSTQLVLLKLCVVLGIFLAVTSVYGAALNLWRLFNVKKARYLFRAGGYMLLVIFGAAAVLAAKFIITASGGNAG